MQRDVLLGGMAARVIELDGRKQNHFCILVSLSNYYWVHKILFEVVQKLYFYTRQRLSSDEPILDQRDSYIDERQPFTWCYT